MNEEFEEMPERTWLSSPSLAFENALGCWFSSRRGVAPHEYTRSDLVPAWHDAPTCEGLWLIVCRDRDELLKVGQIEPRWDLWMRVRGATRAFGPIPEDKR